MIIEMTQNILYEMFTLVEGWPKNSENNYSPVKHTMEIVEHSL